MMILHQLLDVQSKEYAGLLSSFSRRGSGIHPPPPLHAFGRPPLSVVGNRASASESVSRKRHGDNVATTGEWSISLLTCSISSYRNCGASMTIWILEGLVYFKPGNRKSSHALRIDEGIEWDSLRSKQNSAFPTSILKPSPASIDRYMKSCHRYNWQSFFHSRRYGKCFYGAVYCNSVLLELARSEIFLTSIFLHKRKIVCSDFFKA